MLSGRRLAWIFRIGRHDLIVERFFCSEKYKSHKYPLLWKRFCRLTDYVVDDCIELLVGNNFAECCVLCRQKGIFKKYGSKKKKKKNKANQQ